MSGQGPSMCGEGLLCGALALAGRCLPRWCAVLALLVMQRCGLSCFPHTQLQLQVGGLLACSSSKALSNGIGHTHVAGVVVTS